MGFHLFLLRLRQNLREMRKNSGKFQKFADIFLKQTYSKSYETIDNK